jgi:hypothetical protein
MKSLRNAKRFIHAAVMHNTAETFNIDILLEHTDSKV